MPFSRYSGSFSAMREVASSVLVHAHVIVIDNASNLNLKKVKYLLAAQHDHVLFMQCWAYQINLAVRDVLQNRGFFT